MKAVKRSSVASYVYCDRIESERIDGRRHYKITADLRDGTVSLELDDEEAERLHQLTEAIVNRWFDDTHICPEELDDDQDEEEDPDHRTG